MTTDIDAGPSRMKKMLTGIRPHASEQETSTDASQLIASRTSNLRISAEQSMPVNELPHYSMKHTRRGTALIFENLLPTEGTDRDERHLIECLKNLDFDVVVKKNLLAQTIKTEIESAAQEDHRDADCFLCVFLTHGDDGIIHRNDRLPSNQLEATSVKLQEDVFDQFRGDKCKSLRGKPKIFIIQACREENDQDVVNSDEVDAMIELKPDAKAKKGNKPTIPSGADFLICYSTSEGFFAFRNTDDGSWYISALCKALVKHGKEEEFTKILTKVHHEVSKRSAKGGKKQMPCFVSMLTKQLLFSSR